MAAGFENFILLQSTRQINLIFFFTNFNDNFLHPGVAAHN
jgi:hypothetical protein